MKRISVLLAILMIFSSFPMFSASANEYVSPDNVTYLDTGFPTVGVEDWYAWTWNDNAGGRWVQGDEVSPGVYAFSYLDYNVLFARVDKTKKADWYNGSVYNQTEDLVNHTADYFYVITAWNSSSSDKMQGKWEFVGPDKPPIDPTEVYYTVEPPTTDPVTEPSTDNAHDSLYNTYQRIRDSIPVGGTPYTKESQQRFNTALRAAEDLLDDATATDTQLREAEQELIDAYNSLEYSTADRTKLWTAIEKLRPIIESGEYKNYSNADELKEIYDYALPIVYYEPDQSVIDEWEAKIYAALQKAGVITEPTTEPNYTEPSTTGYTEPTATTEDPTGHCTEFDLPYSPDFAVALANYTNNLMGESLSVSDIDLFHYDQTTVVFGLSDNLCTEGHENIDGYHFENWNFFPHEANKTGYCVYYNGTIYNLPDAVKNNIMSASTLASIIPHSSKIDNSTTPTSSTATSESTFITEPTIPSETNPTTGDSRARDDLSKLLTKYKWVYEECKNSSSQSIFYFESVQGFIGAYESAQALINDGTATEQQYVVAHNNLTQAYANLTEAPTQGTEVTDARRALKYAVYNCVPRDGYEYTSEAMSAYNQAYDEAMDLLNGNDATDDQLRTARAKLFSAYNELMRTATYIKEPTTATPTQPYDYYGEMIKAIKARHADAGVESYHINIMTLKPLSNGTQLVRYSVSIFLYTQEMHVEHFGKWTYETANPAAEIYDGENFYSLTEAYEKGLINDSIIRDEIFGTISYIYIDVPVTISTEPSSTEPITETNSTETTPTQPASTAPVTYNISKAKVAAIGNKTYTGKAITPTVKVTYNGKILLKNKDYTLSFKNNKNVGTASIIITGKGSYTGTKTVTFKIVKAANTMTVKATAKTVKYTSLKKAKQTVSAITVKKAIGKVSYKKTSGKSLFTVNSKTGKITIKKGTAKGTYTVKVKVSAAGNSNYKSGSKTVTVKITIK